MLFTKAIIYACEDVDHQLVWNQLTIVDITLSSLTKFCTVLDFITEYITCRNVTETIFLDHLVALSTFTSTWSTENYDIFHLLYYVYKIICCYSSTILLHYRIDITEVSAFLIIIQPISHDKIIRDFHHCIIDIEMNLQVTRFHEKRADFY